MSDLTTFDQLVSNATPEEIELLIQAINGLIEALSDGSIG